MWLWRQTRSFAAGVVVGTLFVASGVAVYSNVPDLSTQLNFGKKS